MKRSLFAIASMLALPVLGAVAAAPASAAIAFQPPVLSISNTPEVYNVNQSGNTITYTLTQSNDTLDLDETYVVTATVPDSFTVTGSDKGDFSDCETEGQVVTCTIDTALDESQSVSFTISVTPTQVGTFPATGTFTYEEIVPEVKTPAKGRVADLSRAPAATTTSTVTHNIQVVGPAASPTPTVSSAPTKTAAPTHTPTHKATHKPTHKATVRATATTKAQTQVLPNTGGSDLGELAAAGSALVVVGAWVTIATRRRRPASGRHR